MAQEQNSGGASERRGRFVMLGWTDHMGAVSMFGVRCGGME